MTTANEVQTSIILSTGIYDLLKNELRTRRLSKYNEEKLIRELKYAKQVLNKELPEDVVTVNKSVRVKELATGQEHTFNLVPPAKARRKHNTMSILSPIGVAIVGYKEGAEVRWEMPDGVKDFRIEEVAPLASKG